MFNYTNLSLVLHIIDGMLAYNNIFIKNRTLGRDIGEYNIVDIINNLLIAVFVMQNMEKPLSRFWRLWPWLFRLAVPNSPKVFKLSNIFPLLDPPKHYYNNMKSGIKELPKFLFSMDIRGQLSDIILDSPWNTAFTFTYEDSTESSWLFKHDIQPLFGQFGEWKHKSLRALVRDRAFKKNLLPAKDSIKAKDINKYLKYYYMESPEILVILFCSRFFPESVRISFDNMDITRFNRFVSYDLLQDCTYYLLKLGFPAIHKLFGKPYPNIDLLAVKDVPLDIPEECLVERLSKDKLSIEQLESSFT